MAGASERGAEGPPVQQIFGRIRPLLVPLLQARTVLRDRECRLVGRSPPAVAAAREVQQPAAVVLDQVERARSTGIFIGHRRSAALCFPDAPKVPMTG